MRLVGYVRVSTQGQAENGLGLDVQERALRKWSKQHGHRLVAICRDEGVSGSIAIEDREGLRSALSMIAGRKEVRGLVREADGLLVARLDRLARTLHVQEAALAHVWRAGGTVFSIDSGEVVQDDPDDPMRRAMRQMMGVFSELERGMIGARLRAARRLKAERGGYAGYGSPPFGTRAVADGLEAREDEQRAVALICRLRGAGESYRAVCAALEAEGLRPRGRKGATPAGWQPAVVRRIALREVKRQRA